MSRNNYSDDPHGTRSDETTATPPGESVLDEEGEVDRKVKQRILNSRDRVDDREDLLFAAPLVNPELSFQPDKALSAWGNAVRQYLRNIEPLLTTDDIQQAKFYYRQIELGTETLTPPNTQEYKFSKFANETYNPSVLIRRMGLPRTCSPPEPETVSFDGLISLIETEVIEHRWTVCVDNNGPPPQHEYVELEVRRPVPRRILENAVRAADQFLQRAGIGLEVGTKQVDERADPF